MIIQGRAAFAEWLAISVWGFALTVFALTMPSPSHADANPQDPDSCPFPSADDEPSHARRGYDEASQASASYASDDVPCSIDSGSFFTSSSSSSSSSGSAGQDLRLEWPGEIGLRLDGGYGYLDYADTTFSNADGTFELDGRAMSVGAVSLAGGEIGVDVELSDPLRIGGGFGFYAPIGGELGGIVESPRLGEGARSSGFLMATPFLETYLVQRTGPFTSFVGVRGGIEVADIDVGGDCGCMGNMTALRGFVGPRVGVRAHLWGNLYLAAAIRMDLFHFPDYVTTLGIGFARPAAIQF